MDHDLAGRGGERQFRATLAAIALLALAVRFAAIESQSFWYDEAVTARLAEAGYGDLFLGRARDNGNPPLYWILVKAWAAMFGTTDLAYRALPALIGTLTVPAMALLGRALVDARTGLVAALLLAISPLAVELSNEARTYALVQLLAVASTLSFVAWLRTGPEEEAGRPAGDPDGFSGRTLERSGGSGLGALGCYVVATALACYSHYYAFAVPAAHGLVLLLVPAHRRRLLAWTGAMLLAAVLYAPWTPAFVAQLTTSSNLSRYGDSWLTQFLATPVVFAFGRTLVWRDSGLTALVTVELLALGAVVLPALVALAKAPLRAADRLLLASWWLIPIAGPFAAALAGVPLYSVRYAVVGLPAFLVLVAAGLLQSGWRTRGALGAIIAAGTVMSLYNYATAPLKDDWRAAERIVAEHRAAGELVVFDTDYEVVPYVHYASRHQRVPERMIGVLEPPRGGRLQGVLVAEGGRARLTAAAHDALMEEAGGIWLLLCVPRGSDEDYRRLFEEHGYKLKARRQVPPRTEILHFARERADG